MLVGSWYHESLSLFYFQSLHLKSLTGIQSQEGRVRSVQPFLRCTVRIHTFVQRLCTVCNNSDHLHIPGTTLRSDKCGRLFNLIEKKCILRKSVRFAMVSVYLCCACRTSPSPCTPDTHTHMRIFSPAPAALFYETGRSLLPTKMSGDMARKAKRALSKVYVGNECPTLKPSSLVPVKACQGKRFYLVKG